MVLLLIGSFLVSLVWLIYKINISNKENQGNNSFFETIASF